MVIAKTFAALFALLLIIRYFSGLQGTPRGQKRRTQLHFQDLTIFFVDEGTREERREYTRMLGKLFIIEFVAFGWAEILDLEIFIARCVVAWVLAGRFVEAYRNGDISI